MELESWLDIALVVGVLFLLLAIGWDFHLRYTFYRKIAEKKFACPNCGLRFHVEWYKLIFNFSAIWECAIIKCPGCGVKDRCKRTDES